MKIKRFCMLWVLMMVLFPVKGYSLITSRIEGTVEDKNTGEPINGAFVVLLRSANFSTYFESYMVMLSRDKGNFKFELWEKGSYLISVFRDGYADFGPIFESQYMEDRTKGFGRGGFGVVSKSFEPGKITIEGGEIKYAKIKLKKESVIEIKFNRKTPKGIEPLSYLIPGCNFPKCPMTFSAFLRWHENNHVTRMLKPQKKKIGLTVFNRLPGGDTVFLSIIAKGYPSKYLNITLEEGKTLVIDHLLDFTSGQVIHGVIKNKSTQQPIEGVDIDIWNIETKNSETIRADTDINGEYWLGGFKAGKYRMRINPTRGKMVLLECEIKENQILEINKEL